jgi:Gpi18-like mannosyltransferase
MRKSLLFLLVIAVLVRIAASFIDAAYQNDVLTFQYWAFQLFENGLTNFYSSGGFTDYPPVYMYVLYVLGMLGSFMGLDYSTSGFNLLIRLPAIFCDAALGYLIYRTVAKLLEQYAARTEQN